MSMVFNNRGEEVGYIGFYENRLWYFTTRDMKRGQIFAKKTMFSGKEIRNGVAIDSAILKKLFANNIKGIIYLIKNFESRSFYGKIDLFKFMEVSEEICYDKFDSRGRNITKYGHQRIIGMNELERTKI